MEQLSAEVKMLYETEYVDHDDRIRAQTEFINRLLGEEWNLLLCNNTAKALYWLVS